MSTSIFFRTDAIILCLFLLVGCILMVRLGRFVRNRFFHMDKEESKGGVNSLLAALFGLWGFILAFTFGNSSSHFQNVSNTMVDEYNTIRNVIYRSEGIPDSMRIGFQADLNNYIQARIDYYRSAGDIEKFNKATQDTRTLSRILWARTQRLSTLPEMGGAAATIFGSLTSMYDLAAKRDVMLMTGVPEAVFYLLFFLALVVSFTGGFTTPVIGTKEWVVITSFILLACILIYISLDLSRPMRGFIKPSVAQERIENLQQLFLDTKK